MTVVKVPDNRSHDLPMDLCDSSVTLDVTVRRKERRRREREKEKEKVNEAIIRQKKVSKVSMMTSAKSFGLNFSSFVFCSHKK